MIIVTAFLYRILLSLFEWLITNVSAETDCSLPYEGGGRYLNTRAGGVRDRFQWWQRFECLSHSFLWVTFATSYILNFLIFFNS